MATNLDLEEQEQLDQLKDFWQRYGNLITWTLVIGLLGIGGWNGWQWWQRSQAAKAAGMYTELEKAADKGDAEVASRVFADMRDRYPGTAFTAQAGLLAAKVQSDKDKADDARASLQWVADHASDADYRVIARLRLAGVLLDQKKYDEALKLASDDVPDSFKALAADRRGDILAAMGKRDEAVAAYKQAYSGMDDKSDYRRLVEAKLTAMGAAPDVPPAPASVAAPAATDANPAAVAASAAVSAAASAALSSAAGAASGASR